MRTKLLPSLLLGLLSLSLLTNCQKSSDSKTAKNAAVDKASDLDSKSIVPDNVCSDEVKKIAASIADAGKHIISASDSTSSSDHQKMESASSAQEKRTYGQKQIENCKAFEDRFNKENIEACLKTAGTKTKENTIFKAKTVSYCKTVGHWLKAVTKTENNYTSELAQQTIDTFKFSDKATQLINPANKAEINFIANKELQYGKDNFKRVVQEGSAACFMTNPGSASLPDSFVFSYVGDDSMKDSSPEIKDFEFNGTHTTITLKNESLFSMFCLNLKLTNEKDKKSALEKVFGDLIAVSTKEVLKTNSSNEKDLNAKLNKDVAPTTQPGEASSTGSAKANAVVATTAKNPLADGAATVGTQIKDVTDHVIDKGSAAGSKLITEAEMAATSIINKTQDAVIDTVSKPFVAAGNGFKKLMFEPFYIPKKIWGFMSSMFTNEDEAKKSNPETRALTQEPASEWE